MSVKLILPVKFIYLIALAINLVKNAEGHENCEKMVSFYDDIGCKRVDSSTNDICSGSFDCPDFTKYDENKCFWKGKPYNLHGKPKENISLAPGQLTIYLADSATVFRYFSKDKRIAYKYIGDSGDYWDYNSVQLGYMLPMRPLYKTKESKAEYIDYDNSTEKDMDYYFTSYSCYEIGCACGKRGVFGCFRPIECPENVDQNKMCYVQGRTYNLDEKFPADEHDCFCAYNFDNTTAISENTNCAKSQPGFGIETSSRMTYEIMKGCVPIFRKSHFDPVDYKCPTNDDAIEPRTKLIFSTTDETCIFGNLILKRGEQLFTRLNVRSRGYYECKCIMPPFITCFKYN